MSGQSKKKDISEKTLRFIFGAVLIAAAVGLFLISDAGRALMTGNTGNRGETASPDATPQTDAPEALVPEAFIERVSGAGAAGAYEQTSAGADAVAYAIRREGMDDVSLILTLREGRVRAFSLVWTPPLRPALPQNATPIERDVYEAQSALYAKDTAWLAAAFSAMLDALDPMKVLSPVARDSFFALAEDALSSGKRRTDSASGFECAASVAAAQDGGALTLTFSVK